MTPDEITEDIIHNIELGMNTLDDKQMLIKYFGYEGRLWFDSRTGCPRLDFLFTSDQIFPVIRYQMRSGLESIIYASVHKYEYKSDARNTPPMHSLRDAGGEIIGVQDIINYPDFYVTINYRKLKEYVRTEPFEENKERYKQFLKLILGLVSADDIISTMIGG